jgi:hypothetical protein
MFIEVHISNELLYRYTVEDFDETVNRETWTESVVMREKLVRMVFEKFINSINPKLAAMKNVQYYIIFQSRLNENYEYTR